jgi:hypothetical protein
MKRGTVTQIEEKTYDYHKLRLDVIEKLINHREIECKDNRTDMIRQLMLYDEGKYVRETTIEKYDKEKFLIGIDSINQDLMVKMGKLVEKGEAKRAHYANCRHYYISNINILENEVD